MTTSPPSESPSFAPDDPKQPQFDPLKAFLAFFGSFKLCFSLLIFMGIITYLGTMAQATMSLFDAQLTYFDSWMVIEYIEIPGAEFQPGIPLPGGMLLMTLLITNLIVGGIMRLKVSRRNFGVLITHLGVILLLTAGFVRYAMSTEGAIQVYEGENSSQFQSYHSWEISISARTSQEKIERWTIPWHDITDIGTKKSRVFKNKDLPFELNVYAFLENSLPRKAGRRAVLPVVDGFYLEERERNKKNSEFNVAGCYVTLMAPSGNNNHQEAILWAGGTIPFTANFDGREYDIHLRRETHRLPFDLELADFRAIYYPRTRMPKAYESDVVIRDLVDGVPRGNGVKVNISMNRPLRKEGYALYQSSFGPQGGDINGPMFSVFSVAKNPSDQVPLIACIIIALGMLIHFTQKFTKWIQKEQKGRAA